MLPARSSRKRYLDDRAAGGMVGGR